MIVKNFRIKKGKRNALLINPPVYSFSNFKLEYSQPIGLLRISSLLKKRGVDTTLIDCMETIDNCNIHSLYKRGKNLLSKYHYGISFDILEEKLTALPFEPEEVYVTSFATYWYESTRDTISLIRKIYPNTNIIVGGIYPTLMPENANYILGADIVVQGEVEGANVQPIDLSQYSSPNYLGIKPSQGCPHNCGYCAQRIINKGKMFFQDPKKVCDDIEYWYYTKNVDQVFIFSENFLINKQHFITLLKEIIKRNIKVQIGAPKGMEPRLLDKSLLLLMKEAGWKGIRLALETKSEKQRKKMGRLFNDTYDYEKAISYAIDAGFTKSEIGTFLLYGIPEETSEDILGTAKYINSFGGYIIPMAFTPVPGSRIFKEYFHILNNKDLTELAGNLYPFAEHNGYNFEDYHDLEKYFAELNRANAIESQWPIDLIEIEKKCSGIFAKSEIAFTMGL